MQLGTTKNSLVRPPKPEAYIRTQVKVTSVDLVTTKITTQLAFCAFMGIQKEKIKVFNECAKSNLQEIGSNAFPKESKVQDDGSVLPWNPNYMYLNQCGGVSFLREPKWLVDTTNMMAYNEFTIEVTCDAVFNLRQFPYDRQEILLPLNFRSQYYNYIETLEESGAGFGDIIPQIWNLHTPLETILSPLVNDEYFMPKDGACRIDKDGRGRPCIVILLERRPRSWLINTIMP